MAGTHIPKRSLIESLSLPLTIPRYGQHTTLKWVLKSTSANVDIGLESRVRGRVAVGDIPHGQGKQVMSPPPAPLKTARRGFAVSAFGAASRCLPCAASRCLPLFRLRGVCLFGFAVSAFVFGF